jgi:hypothetical protein
MDNKKNNFLANIHDDVYDTGKQRSARRNSGRGGIQKPSPSVNVDQLPYNHYTPSWARTFDFRKLTEAPANSGESLLFEFQVPKGQTLVWTHYGLFNDALLTEKSYFRVTIDNNEVLRYHGDPSDNFKLSLGGNASLDESSLFEANITIQPNQTVRWYVINTDDVIVTMGVRMKGFLDNSNRIQANRFGG